MASTGWVTVSFHCTPVCQPVYGIHGLVGLRADDAHFFIVAQHMGGHAQQLAHLSDRVFHENEGRGDKMSCFVQKAGNVVL